MSGRYHREYVHVEHTDKICNKILVNGIGYMGPNMYENNPDNVWYSITKEELAKFKKKNQKKD